MIRGKLPEKFSYKKNDLILQIIDWKECDIYISDEDTNDNEDLDNEDTKKFKKNKKLVIRGYGVTDNGNSICVHIHDFQPYFYFKIPCDWDKIKFNEFKNNVLKMVDPRQHDGLASAEIVERKEFYGFTNNEFFKYGIFSFKNQSAYYTFKKVMKEKKILIKKWNKEFDFSNKLYETKVSSLLRFFHVQDIDPSGWLIVKAGSYTKNIPSLTRTQIDISLNYKNIAKIDNNNIAKILIASFDIECCSEDGSFPKFDRKNDPIIQIGTTVYTFGENDCKYKYIATLNKCDPIEGVHVESFYTEKDLILGWVKFMEELDPDVITGYNIWGFDWEYIYKRAETGNGGQVTPYHDILYQKLQRLKPEEFTTKKTELKIQDLSSSALGVNILKYIDIEGVVQIDLLKVVQRDHKLDSYKLDNVAKTFMKQQKVDLSPKELFKNFKEGTSDKIKEIAVYCIMDCVLVNELINKLQVVTNNLGMSNVCVVPFSYLFLRGQGIKIFSLVAKFCREENFLIKDLSEDDIDKNSYEGAIVFVPIPGIYFEPVVVMDYNSLYPSSMIAENISHDSIVGYKEYGLSDTKQKETNKATISITTQPEYELVKNTINTKYDNLPGYHYIDIEYDIFQGLDDDKKKVGYKVCRFAESDNGDKSVLPRILRKLLKARKDTRKIMEYKTISLKDGTSIEGIPDDKGDIYEVFNVVSGKTKIPKSDVVLMKDTNNDFQKSVLDGLQLAYKVTCNSLYGQVGATTSPICYKELAACTTATGRKMVITARDLTLNTFVGAKLTYGDSVTGDTPLLVMKNGFVNVVLIKELNNEWISYDNFKPFDDISNRKEKQQTYSDYFIWTNEGWSKINRVIRHKTHKKIYRVTTDIGTVDVTEDHSLLDKNKNIIKPCECKPLETELLHKFPKSFLYYEYFDMSINEMKGIIDDLYNGMIDIIPYEILNGKPITKKEFMKLYLQKGSVPKQDKNNFKLFYQSLYYLIKSIEQDVIFMCKQMNINIDDIIPVKLNGSQKIQKIEYLYDTSDYGRACSHVSLVESKLKKKSMIQDFNGADFVYDIETESGNFQAGIGQMIVKNTDSIFVNFTDTIKHKYPDRTFTEKELLEESIIIGQEAAANINSHMKAPQNIEYEKTFWPFCIFSKKRYFGNKYEHDIEKYKQTSMGIVLKRRDNAPIVKTIYGGVIDIILNKRNVEDSKKFFHSSIKDLLDGKVDLSQLVISKTVKTDYANPNQIAHKVLADRMGDRDPGNKPQSNDRIPYCYIDTCNLLCKICEVKVSPEKCKCINCMNIYCVYHLNNHRESCVKTCRFCKLNGTQSALTKCNTCNGHYCGKCLEKHKKRTDKYKAVHYDKCKKALTPKLLQGDTIEHPAYITEKKMKIDYKYYLEHQIEKPVYQIFELVMKNPASIIADLVRKMNNEKNGNSSIKDWLLAMGKKPSTIKLDEDKEKFSLTKKIDNAELNEDEENNMLGDQFEEDIIENLDEINFDEVDIIE
jgi:DNA polymerase elongation subunit (family B)